MTELIAIIVLPASLFGIVLIIYRKIPVLAQLPETIDEPREKLWRRLINKIININFIKNFSFSLFLQKILSKIRVLTLKTESKTADWLQKLRKDSQKKDNFSIDNYWQELKNSKGKEKKKKRESDDYKPE